MEQEACRQELYNLLGDLPVSPANAPGVGEERTERSRPISATKIDECEHDGYILEKLTLDLNGIEPVPAYFARPKEISGKVPTVLYNHAHGGDYALGKEEFIKGRNAIQHPTYAKALTERGYCGLCMDTWVFGERYNRTESSVFKEMLWKGQVLWGMMVYDSIRSIDYLVTRPEVDTDRLATLGLSMGSTMAWWVAALDTRIKVCVDICCLTDFHALIEAKGLDGHGIYYYVPNLLKHFTTAQINGLIAPRAHLSLAGNLDKLTPPTGLDRIDSELKEVYAAYGVPERWKLLRYDIGHEETPIMRAEILNFLEKWL
ncbi:acetylxylan esterase [bacterium]|nr:acetylxylan esterase [bacterium]